ncbi:flagellar filament capping protein FliD [Clostridium sp.]|uniref:flagellar filament capping protein FliD n=1 Tax=Clostridium sp. TaxID=1506 RepID=UPI002621169D|nr:flagellar filament capping protein FliD [Clostridium sp.]
MTTRITGLISGLDVDSLVKAGVSSYQTKLDKAKQQEQILEWKQEQYRAISTSVSDFYNKYLDSTSSDSLLMSSNWATTTFTSSNSAAVSATAVNGSASAANYKVDVTTLASAATATLTSSSSYSGGITITTSNNTYSLSGTDITGISGWSSMTEDQKGAAVTNLITSKLGSSSGLTATYSQLSGGIVIKTNTLGANSQFSISTTDSSNIVTTNSYKGTDLSGSITNSSGTVNYALSGNSNTVTLDNIQFNFNDTTQAGSPVTLTGSTDTTTLQSKIESFMKDYNTLLTTINGKIYESYDSSYLPLTDDEKSSMTDTQITQWQNKAQTGLLHNDEYLESLASDMKSAMSSYMKSMGLDIEGIGIKPVEDYGSKNGTYNVDSTALKSALNGGLTKNGQTVTIADIQSLFTNVSSSSTATQSSSSDGVLYQLKVALNNNVLNSGSEFQKVAGTVGTTSEYTNEITTKLKDETTLINTLTDQLNTQEDALYLKYSNLETQLSKLKSSSGIFSSSSSS